MDARGARCEPGSRDDLRWLQRFTPKLLGSFNKRKALVCARWQLDETYVTMNGKERPLHGAVDKQGGTVESVNSP